MAHVEKYTAADVTGIFIHYDRSPGHSLSNKDIDTSRTYLNYNLAANDQPMSQKKFLKKRLSEIKTNGRKTQNVIFDWVITQPPEVKEEDSRKFFNAAYSFLCDRYGRKNTVSAYVHMDEVGNTPHMHFCSVPVEVLEDGTEKLNAKAVINRTELQKFHKDLQTAMDQAMGYHIGITTGITKAQGGNKTIQELKDETAMIEALPQGKKKMLSKDVTYTQEEDAHLRRMVAKGISYEAEKESIQSEKKKIEASAAAINEKNRSLKEKEAQLKDDQEFADLILKASQAPSAKQYVDMVKDNERLTKYSEILQKDLYTVAKNVGSEIMKEIPIQTKLNYKSIPEEPSSSVMRVIRSWIKNLTENLQSLKTAVLNITARVHIFSRDYNHPAIEELKEDVDQELPECVKSQDIQEAIDEIEAPVYGYYR